MCVILHIRISRLKKTGKVQRKTGESPSHIYRQRIVPEGKMNSKKGGGSNSSSHLFVDKFLSINIGTPVTAQLPFYLHVIISI